ncbi:MAG: DUF2975 domain-containing protein [Rhodospirillum sp.]|nr:DUF2975 domain-containing protein [Rhodospirillum sp.]MCF8490610.1 DUF2975 domain-containing protein [Rhodospirillum sp.]MCF8498943.1 DUF2975 domain-containing protein [Rhodospirillum sp.]
MPLTVPSRVRRICHVMSVACGLGALALPLAGAWGAWNYQDLVGSPPPEGMAPSLVWQGVAAVLLSLPMIWVGVGLVRLAALFRDQARGLVFTDANADRVRVFGSCLVLGAVLNPVVQTLAILALTHGFPPGSRLIQIGLGLDDAVLATIGGGMAVLGWVMGEARRLSEDLEGIV